MTIIVNKFVGQKLRLIIFLVCFSWFGACVSTKNVVYFPDLKNDTLFSANSLGEPIIQNNDLFSISVSSRSAEASMMFNLPQSAVTGTTPGYLVNESGEIQFPVLGNIKVAGLTKSQLKRLITKSLSDNKYLIDPGVSIRYLNFRVTVLGEVAKPSVISIPSEKISLLEAIGLAGDITIYGKRDYVLLIREENDQKITRRLNLNSSELFTSGFYYLKSNDVIYVEPTKARVGSVSRTQQWLPMVLSALSIVVIVADRLIK
jgi:polysaccharide export outer membrane protein